MIESELSYAGESGATIEATAWLPDGEPRLVVQVAHGAGEHMARYRRFASGLTSRGLAVYANDHRGHGRTADRHGTSGVARPGGWAAMIDDVHRLGQRVREQHPGAPLVLFGHSMGSFIAQRHVQSWGDELVGVVFSGSSRGLAGADELVPILAAAAAADPDGDSELFSAMFAGFNAAFGGDDATGFEWLSRDPAEVRAYVDDPWCGHALSNGFVLDMIEGLLATWEPEAEAGVPKRLPTLVLAGDDDPVGDGGAGPRALAERYEELGVGPVTLRLYPGGRHEMLNETNRREVESDIWAWLDDLLGDDG